MAQLQNLTINDTGNLTLPSGTTAQRPNNTATVVSFTSVGTTSWTAPAGVNSVEVLVVAGGGGGGNRHAGGGGGGGVIYNSAYPVTPGTSYTVTVGAGSNGATSTTVTGNAGGNSVFASLTALGGGAGVSDNGNPSGRHNGGSGGGGAYYSNFPTGGTGVLGQGNPGGTASLPGVAGAGGGGAGGPGKANVIDDGGEGGPGIAYAISGSTIYYGSGGGGGSGPSTGVGGRAGFGGTGTGGTTTGSPGNGTANRGQGGGGTGGTVTGGNGSSGIVILRYSLDITSTNPIGQTRFNTNAKSIEKYSNNNVFLPTVSNYEVVRNGLLLHYDAAIYSSGTTILDLSGNGNNGTLVNSPTLSTEAGGTLQFSPASGNYISAGNLGSTQEFTVQMFVKVNSNPGGYDAFAGANNGASFDYTTGFNIDMFANVTSSVSFIAMEGAGVSQINYIESPTHGHLPIPFGKYFNLCVVTRRESITVYINGRVARTVARSTPDASIGLSNLVFATRPVTNTPQSYTFDGSVGTVLFYTRALTTTEVERNYSSQAARFFSPPLPPVVIKNGNNLPLVKQGLYLYVDPSNPSSMPNAESQIIRDLSGFGHDLIGSGARRWIDNKVSPYFQQNQSNYAYFTRDGGTLSTYTNSPDMTATCWATWAGHTSGADDYLFNVYSGGSTQQSRALRMNGSNLSFVGNGSGAQDQNSLTALTQNIWYSFTIQVQNFVNVYVILNNNQIFGPYSKTLSSGGGGGITYGNTFWYGGGAANVWQGRLGAFTVYNRILSREEMTQNWEALRGKYGYS